MFRITTFSDYREYSPAGRRRILARIRGDSFDAVRFRIDRAVTETAFHRYDDSFADTFFEDAAAEGLKAIPALLFHTPPWKMPMWRGRSNNQTRFPDQCG